MPRKEPKRDPAVVLPIPPWIGNEKAYPYGPPPGLLTSPEDKKAIRAEVKRRVGDAWKLAFDYLGETEARKIWLAAAHSRPGRPKGPMDPIEDERMLAVYDAVVSRSGSAGALAESVRRLMETDIGSGMKNPASRYEALRKRLSGAIADREEERKRRQLLLGALQRVHPASFFDPEAEQSVTSPPDGVTGGK